MAGGSDICPKQVVIELTQALDQVECGSGDQGADMLKWTDRAFRMSVTRTPSDLSATPWTDAPGATVAALQVDACTTPGRAFSSLIAAPQVAEQPAPVANGNLLGLTTIYEAAIYSGDTGTTAPADTLARIAFM